MIDNRYKIISATYYDEPLIDIYPELKNFRFEPEDDIESGVDIIPSENHGGSIELNTMADMRRLMSAVDNRLVLYKIDRSPYDMPGYVIVIYDGYIE